MTEPAGLGDLARLKGWIKVDFNRAVWVPCPPAFPEGDDRRGWAAFFAETWWQGSGLKHGKRQVNALEHALEEMHAYIYGESKIQCHQALIHLPDPRLVPLPVYFAVYPAEGDRDAQLRALTHAGAPDAVEPPIVSEVETDRLGDGLKVLCYTPGNEPSSVSAVLSYAWRSERYETAVRMFTVSPDIGRLQGAMDDIDELARTVDIVPRNV
jgi:hypothetical protein